MIYNTTYDYRPISTGANFVSGYAFKSKDFADEGIAVIKIKNIQNQKVDLEESQYFPESLYSEKLAKFKVFNGDVLIAMTGQGSVGRVGKVRIQDSQEALLNQRVGNFKCDEENLNLDYLFYVISSEPYERYLFNKAIGSGQPNLSPNDILEVEIPFPPLPEQKAIAAILSALDDKIELNLQMNKTLEEMAMTLYKQWFVDFEFPSKALAKDGQAQPYKTAGGKFVESELGMIPEGWEVKTIGQIGLDIGDGNYSSKYPRSSEFVETGVPFIRAVNMVNGTLVRNDLRYITPEKHSTITKGHLKKGDVLLVTRGMIGDLARVPDYFIDANINAQLVRLNGHEIIPSTYLYSYLNDSRTKDRIKANQSGTALQQLPIGALKSIPMIIPDKATMTLFDSKLCDLFRLVDENNDETEALTKTRDTLLPKLISGEVRVKQVVQELKNVL